MKPIFLDLFLIWLSDGNSLITFIGDLRREFISVNPTKSRGGVSSVTWIIMIFSCRVFLI